MLKVNPLSIEIVKGFTKIQCIMFVLMASSDHVITDSDSAELLKPLRQVLDKAWLIPVHATCLNFQVKGSFSIIVIIRDDKSQDVITDFTFCRFNQSFFHMYVGGFFTFKHRYG